MSSNYRFTGRPPDKSDNTRERFIRKLRVDVRDFCERCNPGGFYPSEERCIMCELFVIAKELDEVRET